jgi:hypothetical protein
MLNKRGFYHKGAQRLFTKAREGFMNEKNCRKIPLAPKVVENPFGGLYKRHRNKILKIPKIF